MSGSSGPPKLNQRTCAASSPTGAPPNVPPHPPHAHRNNPNRYVEIRGRAILEDDPERRFVNHIAKLYLGADEYPFDKPGDQRATITIIAEQVSTPPIPMADNPPGAPDAAPQKQ